MPIATVEIKGLPKLERALRILPSKITRKLQLKALRKGGGILVKQVRANAPKRTKTLSKSVGIVNDKNRKGAAIWVAIRIGKKFTYQGWYGWFIHEGTKGFGKRTRSKGETTGYARKGTGINANKFFEKAWDQTNIKVFGFIREELARVTVNYLKSAVPKVYK